MDFVSARREELERELGVDFSRGLSRHAVRERQRKGENVIRARKKKGILALLLAQMSDFMTLVLLAASAASYFSTHMRGETDIFEPVLILAIVVLNACLGVFQQKRAERAIDALKKLAAPHATVLRDGVWQSVDASELVCGDVVKLAAGDRVAADMRIIEAVGLEADESALTGESAPAEKSAAALEKNLPLAERKNMLFCSTSVTSGRAVAVVCAIGMDTEMGKIAGFIMNEEDEQTPLTAKLSVLGKTLGLCALGICAVIFLVGITKKLAPLDMFITAVSLAVAAIPEGLPATVTVMLAIGIERMAKKNAIVKKLAAVETLGTADVICTDKTGTLTENKMKVTEVVCENEEIFSRVLRLASKNCADPTERAVISRFGTPEDGYIQLGENPFDSARKMMSALYEGDGGRFCVAKGAAEVILKKCDIQLTRGGEKPLDAAQRSRLLRTASELAGKGLRVIGAAYKKSEELCEEGLVFCGFAGICDPPRREAAQAVAECHAAGIRVVMITGDHMLTAQNIARSVGIYKDGDRTLSGRELDELGNTELDKIIDSVSVFARTAPEQKLRIIKAYKRCGHIAAMTGDGINDAPALKAADIGCSMGKNGTDVAKEASDMVLADDNFATIVAAVREGRRIFANIRKSVMFLLSSNIGELLCVFLGLLFGGRTPLLATQLLWVNLVTDSLPAVALGLDPENKDIMHRPPEHGDRIFARSGWACVLTEGAMIGALALLAFTAGLHMGGTYTAARTMAFVVLALSQLVHAFNMRDSKPVVGSALFANRPLIFSLVLGVILTNLLIFIPQTAELFGVCRLSAGENGVCTALCAAPLFIVETAKRCERYFTEKRNRSNNFLP